MDEQTVLYINQTVACTDYLKGRGGKKKRAHIVDHCRGYLRICVLAPKRTLEGSLAHVLALTGAF